MIEELPPSPTYRRRDFMARLPPIQPEHTANRPDSWNCRVCGAEWPCDPAKVAMRSEAQRTYLGMLMWGYLEEFIDTATAEEFKRSFERFIAWTR